MTSRRGAISLANAIVLLVLVTAIGVVLFVRGGGGGAADVAQSESLFATSASFQQAKTTAADQGKIVFVLATADWCPPCRSFRGGTLADPEVQAHINSIAVPYKLDVTSRELPQHDAALAQMLGVSSIPAIYAIDADNNVIATAVGDMSAGQLTGWLDAAKAKQ